MKIYDGHVHSPYCPHGTTDRFEAYIEHAFRLGYSGLTFTEHAPLPLGFIDPTPDSDSAMEWEYLPHYLEELKKLQLFYKDKMQIRIGLEVDFIEGYEEQTKDFLEEFGPKLDDSILSVHFLKLGESYYCLDYSLEGFERILNQCNDSLEELYHNYLNTLEASILSDLGSYKPKRLGHITLPTKFQKKYPMPKAMAEPFLNLLPLIQQHQLSLDYNGAGTQKPYCKETYPPKWLALKAASLDIPLIYGSDAHAAADLGQGLDKIEKAVHLSTPIF